MIIYDKSEIKAALTVEQIYDLLIDWGGEPVYTSFGLTSRTICHNHPNENCSRKLYYYSGSTLFHCFTGCAEASFDVFQLCSKVMKIQYDKDFNLNDSVMWIVRRFGLSGMVQEDEEGFYNNAADWELFSRYSRIQEIEYKISKVVLKEYDSSILKNFNYDVKITPWLNDGISQEILNKAGICFYPGNDQIVIPHFDVEGRLIGIRGRTLSKEDAEFYGKYRPLNVNKQWYSHPLGMNLYGLNWNKNNIQKMGKAIIFESEKSVLQYATMFGWNNNISVACCGSSISAHQIQLLLDYNVREIIIALDRQFKRIGDDEYKRLTANLSKINSKYKNDVLISCLLDKKRITGYKASPTDEGKEKFLQLYKERLYL